MFTWHHVHTYICSMSLTVSWDSVLLQYHIKVPMLTESYVWTVEWSIHRILTEVPMTSPPIAQIWLFCTSIHWNHTVLPSTVVQISSSGTLTSSGTSISLTHSTQKSCSIVVILHAVTFLYQFCILWHHSSTPYLFQQFQESISNAKAISSNPITPQHLSKQLITCFSTQAKSELYVRFLRNPHFQHTVKLPPPSARTPIRCALVSHWHPRCSYLNQCWFSCMSCFIDLHGKLLSHVSLHVCLRASCTPLPDGK